MKKLFGILIIIVSISISCRKNEFIEPELYNKIKEYISQSEDYAKQTTTYDERDIYIVKFISVDSSEYIKIFENNYYYKSALDGYITIGDNKVFFYNTNEDFLKKEFLHSDKELDLPDENSNAVDEGFNSRSWYFEIRENLNLVKIDDENFILY